jgi:hypothetical protein
MWYNSDIFPSFNRIFAALDAELRNVEKDLGVKNTLPSISVPTVRQYYDDRRTYNDGEKTEYFKNGKLHREDGPAVIWNDGKKQSEYWLEGRQVDKKEVENYQQKLADEKIHRIFVGEKEYKVKGKYLSEIIEKLNRFAEK